MTEKDRLAPAKAADGVNRRDLLAGAGAAGMFGLAVGGLAGGLVGRAQADGTTSPAAVTEAKGKPIVIGFPAAQTGAFAGDGQEMRRGGELALDEINGAGGVGGRPIKTTTVDLDPYNPDSAQRAYRQLVNDKVDAIYTGFLQAYAAIIDLSAAYGAPFLSATTEQAMIDKIRSDKKYGNVFHIDPPEVWYGRSFPGFLNALKAGGRWKPANNRVHLIEADDVYSQVISREAAKAFADDGKWQVVETSKVTAPVNDWSSVLQRVRARGAGVVMNTHSFVEAIAAFAKQFAARPTQALLYLQYAPSVPEFLSLAGKAADGVIWSTITGVYPDDLGLVFQKRYEDKYGERPGVSNSGSAYDAFHLLALAWGVAGDPRNFPAVCQALRVLRHRGVNGSYTMTEQAGLAYPSETKDPSLGQATLFFQIQDGKHRVIDPQPYVQTEFSSPTWLA